MDGANDPCMEPSLRFGVAVIDDDHALLFDLFEQLKEAGRDEEADAMVGMILGMLIDYADYHFSREERLQKAIRYPDLEAHAASHQEIRDRLDGFKSNYDADPASVNVGELCGFLHCWLARHILNEDAKYVPYIANNPEALQNAEDAEFRTFVGVSAELGGANA